MCPCVSRRSSNVLEDCSEVFGNKFVNGLYLGLLPDSTLHPRDRFLRSKLSDANPNSH